MRLLSAEFPDQFPFHRNWKTTDTHPVYWSLSATHDHVVPLSHGGDPLDAGNIVTACWPCNSRKSGLLLDDVGFNFPENVDALHEKRSPCSGR
ncbi:MULTISPECIES: HNH endonuclease [unclassified Rhodococcus (in: high G+C Gram-positive bacteria)]|uniref:HNH endonuclease n=1 Tax=unclassified Rhodococcus (in: high G+C Gram-positive bacteria) TaxID=192944 RepID=UPI0020790BE3|nr:MULTISPECIES: HNH endonuclease [unclassified Rhodococcus (in: high G+C Gram-positive bacteria)]